MEEFSKYVGLDVHKEKINVAVAAEGREEACYWGEIDNLPEAVRKLLGRLSRNGRGCGYASSWPHGPAS